MYNFISCNKQNENIEGSGIGKRAKSLRFLFFSWGDPNKSLKLYISTSKSDASIDISAVIV